MYDGMWHARRARRRLLEMLGEEGQAEWATFVARFLNFCIPPAERGLSPSGKGKGNKEEREFRGRWCGPRSREGRKGRGRSMTTEGLRRGEPEIIGQPPTRRMISGPCDSKI